MVTRYEVVLEDDTFFFQLRAADGEVILRSLGSDSKIMTQNEILHLRKTLDNHPNLIPHVSDDGKHFIVAKDKDGSVLAKSIRVDTEMQMKGIAEAVIEAAHAPIVDLAKQKRSAAG